MTNLINKITKLAMIPIIAGTMGLGSCGDNGNDVCKKGTYNNYKVEINLYENNRDICSRHIWIYSNDVKTYNGRAIAGHEYINRAYYEKEFSRFSDFDVNDQLLDKNPILKYANSDSLEKIYNYVYEDGVDVK